MPVGDVGVDITVRLDQLNKGMKQAEKVVKESADRIEKNTEINPFGGVTVAAAKLFASLSILDAGIKGVTAAVQLMKGDFEGLEGTIRSLPLGIGAVAGSFIDFSNTIFGWRDAQQALNAELEKTQRRMKAFEAAASQAAAVQADRVRSLNDELALLNIQANSSFGSDPLGEIERRIAQIQAQADIKVRNAVSGGVRTPDGDIIRPEKEIAKIREIEKVEVDALRKKQEEIKRTAALQRLVRQAELRDAVRLEERNRPAVERDENIRIDDELDSFFSAIEKGHEQQVRNEQSLVNRIELLELESVGKVFEARKRAIEQEASLRRDLAQTDTEREHITRLSNLRIEALERERVKAREIEMDANAAKDRSDLEGFIANRLSTANRTTLGQQIEVGRTNFAAFAPGDGNDPQLQAAKAAVSKLNQIEVNTRAERVRQILGADR